MKKPLSSVRWLCFFFCIVFFMMLLLSAIASYVDPFMLFRVRDNSYHLCEYSAVGLVNNHEYDTLILGSSMTQNFDMNVFRNELNVEPLHIGIGAMKMADMLDLIHTAYSTHRVQNYYLCVDLYLFSNDSSARYIPKYLFINDAVSRSRYLLSHEVWFHYLPLDVGLVVLNKAGISLSSKLNLNTNIDRFGYWGDRESFGEEIVLSNYISGEYRVSDVNTDGLYRRMTKQIDEFLSSFDFSAGKHTFFFPPYSALYWCDTQNAGYLDVYMQAKQYFFEKASAYGAEIYDFQCADFITDLNNYKDTTHYRPEINDYMVKCFANGDYLVTEENQHLFQDKLIENIQAFRIQHDFLFK